MSWFTKNPKKTLFGFVLTVCLVLDLIAGTIFLVDTARRYHPSFHHGFESNSSSRARWGPYTYNLSTNSLGFKDREPREIPLTSHKRRIVVIGDSFTEGVGYSYGQTFVGLTESSLDSTRIEIFNAGVMSYSPKLYLLKIKWLIETVGFQFDELYVYLDFSDIQDEIVYSSFNPHVESLADKIWRKSESFLRNHSYIYRTSRDSLLYGEFKRVLRPAWESLRTRFKNDSTAGIQDPNQPREIDMVKFQQNFDRDRSRWTERSVFEAWGYRGLDLAESHMDELHTLCKSHGIALTIATYPWKNHILQRNPNAVYAAFWGKFASDHNIKYLNYFPDFITGISPVEIITTNYIPDDVHWNENGHMLIARKLISSINETTR